MPELCQVSSKQSGKLHPLTTPEFWERNYRSSVKKYPSKWSRSDRELSFAVHSFLESRRGGDLLEIGCGGSYWLPYFADRYGLDVSGIDFSGPRIQEAVWNLSAVGRSGQMVQGRLEDGPLTPNRFDVVCSFGLIEHFDDPAEALSLCAAYLKLDGWLITTVPHLGGIWGEVSRRVNKAASQGFLELTMDDVLGCHAKANLIPVYAAYFRWMDLGMLNCSNLNLMLRTLFYGAAFAVNLVLLPFLNVSTSATAKSMFFTDMVIVSTKGGRSE